MKRTSGARRGLRYKENTLLGGYSVPEYTAPPSLDYDTTAPARAIDPESSLVFSATSLAGGAIFARTCRTNWGLHRSWRQICVTVRP